MRSIRWGCCVTNGHPPGRKDSLERPLNSHVSRFWRGPGNCSEFYPGFDLPLIKDKGKVDLDRARQSTKTYKSNKLAVRKSSSICGHSCIMLYLVAMSFCFRHVLSCQIKMQHGVAQLIGTGCLASYFLAMDVKSWRITEARWSSPDKLIGRNIRDYKKGRKT